jgi:nucleoside-diphosphate-sugar epimerase
MNKKDNLIAGPDDPILVTGAGGFIGSKVVECLLRRGFRKIRCLARPSSFRARVDAIRGEDSACVEWIQGNLLSQEDCRAAAQDVTVIYHLAAARGEKSIPDAFMNSVVTTRNLLDASLVHARLRRFVNVSSFAVYDNSQNGRSRLLDETCPVEAHPELRGEAYCFAKVKQDAIVSRYGKEFGVPYVIVRPGYVYGPGNEALTGRVGIDTFGVFLHLGGSNPIPMTYVDNCAEAIVLAGLAPGIEGEIFNVVDDDLPSSRQLLRAYKRQVKRFRSLYVPHAASYALCYLWERYSAWSNEQLPPVFNRGRWNANWRMTGYSNRKLKKLCGWQPGVSTAEGISRYFEACRRRMARA